MPRVSKIAAVRAVLAPTIANEQPSYRTSPREIAEACAAIRAAAPRRAEAGYRETEPVRPVQLFPDPMPWRR
jgi:hypothetical protein